VELDVRTLYVADALITAIIGLAMIFYRANSRTYPGFGFWMAGSLSAAFGYSAMFLRGAIPIGLSVLLVNGAFVLAGVLRLDGMLRFLPERKLDRRFYLAPALAMTLAGLFYFVQDSMMIRTALLTAWIVLFTFAIALVFLRAAPAESRSLYVLAGGISLVYGLAMVARTILWMRSPSVGLFDNTGFHAVFFVSVFAYELWFGLLIMMMNTQRLGGELLRSEESLKSHVVKLEKAISEVKTLKGLLPICASCKRIRDDQGYWNQLETYIDKHSEATFTHGICPDCAEKMRSEIEEILCPSAK
jgi:hypothetical protein